MNWYRISSLAIVIVTAVASTLSALPPPPKEEEKNTMKIAMKIVREYLKEKRIEAVSPIEIAGVAIPECTVFAVHFPQFPVPMEPPAPFASNNILIVDKDLKIQHITEHKKLEEFMQSRRVAKNDNDATDICDAWLILSPLLHTDSVFKFGVPKDIKVVTKDGIRTATGAVAVTAGGKGEITATLTFDKDGKLVSVKDQAQLKADLRPICHATLLLDPDPTVRRMCEQSLVVMGRGIKPYLDQQREKASPELRKEIDRVWQRIVDEQR